MQKPPLRTEIEKALDELVSSEEGMRFQVLAVVLGIFTDLNARPSKGT